MREKVDPNIEAGEKLVFSNLIETIPEDSLLRIIVNLTRYLVFKNAMSPSDALTGFDALGRDLRKDYTATWERLHGRQQ